MDSNTHIVYLLHFKQPFKHARHYLGYADNLQVRLALHANGHGARLTQVVKDSGGSWVLARIWTSGSRDLEHRLKRWHSGVKLCPICQGDLTLEQVLAEHQATTSDGNTQSGMPSRSSFSTR